MPARVPLDLATFVMFALVFIVALVLTQRRPGLGIALLTAVIPFDLSRDTGHTTVTLAKMTLLGVAGALLLNRAPLGLLRTRAGVAIGTGLGLIVLATGLSMLAADYREPALRETLKALQYLAIFIVAAIAMHDAPDDPAPRRAIVLTSAVVSLLAIVQILTGAPSGVWYSGHAIPRIAGPLEGPNQLSGYLGIALPIVFALGLDAGARPLDRRLARVALALGGAALVLTLSRAGVITALGALAAVVVWSARARGDAAIRRSSVIALAGGLAAGALVLAAFVLVDTGSFLILSAVFAHFGTVAEVEHAGGVGNRSILWHAAIELWRAHPLFGIGAGNFELEIGRVGPPGVRTHTNSLYLQALVEGGIPLVLATLASVTITLAVFVRAVREGTREPLVLGVACALAGLAVHQVFDFLVFFPKVGDLMWLVTGLALAQLATRSNGNARASRS